MPSVGWARRSAPSRRCARSFARRQAALRGPKPFRRSGSARPLPAHRRRPRRGALELGRSTPRVDPRGVSSPRERVPEGRDPRRRLSRQRLVRWPTARRDFGFRECLRRTIRVRSGGHDAGVVLRRRLRAEARPRARGGVPNRASARGERTAWLVLRSPLRFPPLCHDAHHRLRHARGRRDQRDERLSSVSFPHGPASKARSPRAAHGAGAVSAELSSGLASSPREEASDGRPTSWRPNAPLSAVAHVVASGNAPSGGQDVLGARFELPSASARSALRRR